MKYFYLGLLSVFVFTGCTFISPYTITFTTPDGSTVNPAVDTLDLAVSQEALVYISRVQCDDNDPLELLPVLNEEMPLSMAHNVSLKILEGQELGAKCRVSVTAYDRTTTSTSHKDIELYVLEKLSDEVVEEEVVEEQIVEEEVPVEETTTDETTE